jgi:hypothetical protein
MHGPGLPSPKRPARVVGPGRIPRACRPGPAASPSLPDARQTPEVTLILRNNCWVSFLSVVGAPRCLRCELPRPHLLLRAPSRPLVALLGPLEAYSIGNNSPDDRVAMTRKHFGLLATANPGIIAGISPNATKERVFELETNTCGKALKRTLASKSFGPAASVLRNDKI